jgi:hypothetical protein
MKVRSILGAVAFATVIAQPAFAVTVFSDDFNRAVSTTVGNNWTESESSTGAVAIVHDTGAVGDNQLQLLGNNGNDAIDQAVAQLGGLSTAGLTNITLSFNYLGITSTDADDLLHAEWKLHSAATWTSLQTFALGDTTLPLNASGSLAFGATADDALIDIRLYTAVSNGTPGSTEGAFIDDVVLFGTAAASATPIPGALWLFGTVLAGGAGFGRWRKKRKTAAIGA